MTDFPSPSGRPKGVKSLAFALFRPVLFAVVTIALALGGLVLTHPGKPQVAEQPPTTSAAPASPGAPTAPVAPPATITLSDPEPPPPLTSAELKGFQMKPADQIAEPEPPASDR